MTLKRAHGPVSILGDKNQDMVYGPNFRVHLVLNARPCVSQLSATCCRPAVAP